MIKKDIFSTVIVFAFLLVFPDAYFLPLGSRVHECTLRNGFKVLLKERHQSLAIYIRFKAGSVDEMSGKTGTAHLLEHMLFKGTKTLGTTDYQAERKILDQIDRTANSLMPNCRAQSSAGTVAALKKGLTQLQQEHRKCDQG